MMRLKILAFVDQGVVDATARAVRLDGAARAAPKPTPADPKKAAAEAFERGDHTVRNQTSAELWKRPTTTHTANIYEAAWRGGYFENLREQQIGYARREQEPEFKTGDMVLLDPNTTFARRLGLTPYQADRTKFRVAETTSGHIVVRTDERSLATFRIPTWAVRKPQPEAGRWQLKPDGVVFY